MYTIIVPLLVRTLTWSLSNGVVNVNNKKKKKKKERIDMVYFWFVLLYRGLWVLRGLRTKARK